ncbi:hypothetical protein XarjCFBP7652_19475 [Xanthomonas arboricola]|nr:hypothetical protein XarjCFBP7652_19475 [Xanthomonas arboricola]
MAREHIPIALTLTLSVALRGDWVLRGIGRCVCPGLQRTICGFAVGSLPAYPRGTRRKYVLVGSYAASMPRKVPRR